MQRRFLVAGLVGAVLVVVVFILGQYSPEVPFTVDEQMIEAFPA